MAKKETTKAEMILDNKIILRSVYGKVGMIYFIQPCRNPKTKRFPDHVRPVNSHGDIILKDKELNSDTVWIKETDVIQITDGQVFNLDDKYEKAVWEAIKYCPLIASDIYAKNPDGSSKINGNNSKIMEKRRYGIAELYIDKPGLETQRRVSRKQKVLRACNFIADDPKGHEGRLQMAKLLGKNMVNLPSADVEDYLYSIAEKHPEKIIKLYTGDDLSLRLLFIDARDKKVIYIKNKLYLYGDNIALGATDDAVIEWMKLPKNQKILELIKKDTYPEYYAVPDSQD